MQWTISYPERVCHALVIASAPKLSTQNIAFNDVARQAILTDPDFNKGHYRSHNTVPRILGLTQAPRPADAADALAQAICHGWRGGGTGVDGGTEMVSAGGSVRASARIPAQRRWA